LLNLKKLQNFLPEKCVVVGDAEEKEDICASLKFAEFVFVSWQAMEKFPE